MRVLFHTVDGTGLGHLTRAALLARAMADRVSGLQALVCTNAADLAALDGAPAKVLRLPFTNLDEVRAGDDPTPREVNARAILSAARAFEPDLVVFDTHVPKAILCAPLTVSCARALVLRTLAPAAAARFFEGPLARAFDLLLVPEDLGAPPLPAAASFPPLGPRIRRVGPLLRPSPSREAMARADRGERPLVVATLGGGGAQVAPGKRSADDDASAFARALLTSLVRLREAEPQGRYVLQVGPYGEASPAPPGIEVVRYDPDLPALLARSDLAIALAGYNTVWELVRERVPSVLLVKRSRYEAQRLRASALLDRGAAAAVLEGPDADRIASAAAAALQDRGRREAIASALGRIAVEPGLDAAADALVALARAPLPVLRGPSPCDDPCDGCPVEGRAGGEIGYLAAAGARRLLVPCSAGRLPLGAELEAVRAAGLDPILETTGRMAVQSPEVCEAVRSGTAARLVFFGLDKKIHQRASRAPGTFGATRDLADLSPDGPLVTCRLSTVRLGARRESAVLPIDRRVFFRAARADDLPAVAILRKRWLPYSEVFIHAEAAALTRHRPVVVCKDLCDDRLPGVPVLPLGDVPPDRAAPLLARSGVAVAHAAFATCAGSFLGMVEALGVPLVVSARGHDLYREPRADLAPVFDAASAVLARTEEMAEDLRARGCPAGKVRVLPTGVDLARFAYRDPPEPAGEIAVVAVGRFTPKKGILDALGAFARLARAEPRATLRVFGLGHVDEDPAVVAEARALATAPPLAGRARLCAAVPQEVLARVLSRSHLFLCASRTAPDGDREGLPNAVKEAMAVGLPVVATEHGALRGLVQGAGALAPEADPEALGQALTDLARRTGDWRAMARIARKRIEERFDLARVAADLDHLYDRVSRP